MLIIHHNDNDGRLGAYICAKFGDDGTDVRFVEMDYKDDFDPSARTVLEGERVIIVDFSIKPSEMAALLLITDDVIWLDHHQTAIDKYADLAGSIKGIREEGKRAGCWLAWNYFVSPEADPPRVVSLVSDYDTWTLALANSKALNYGLQTVDTSPMSGTWEALLVPHEVDRIINGGKFVLNFVQQRGKEMADSYGYHAVLDCTKIFCVHNPNPGMDWFWLVKDNGADAFARIAFDGVQYTVSLYSEKIDVSVICKNHGGGGHPGAGGFNCRQLPW